MSNDVSVPLVTLSEEMLEGLEKHGGSRAAGSTKLYRTLANHDELLFDWVSMAWGVRKHCATPIRLRELMIVRAVGLAGSQYAYVGHRRNALAAGATEEEITEVAEWRASQLFTPAERAAFALTDEMVVGVVSDATLREVGEHYSVSEKIELVLTVGFYCMTPRVLNALRVTPD